MDNASGLLEEPFAVPVRTLRCGAHLETGSAVAVPGVGASDVCLAAKRVAGQGSQGDA